MKDALDYICENTGLDIHIANGIEDVLEHVDAWERKTCGSFLDWYKATSVPALCDIAFDVGVDRRYLASLSGFSSDTISCLELVDSEYLSKQAAARLHGYMTTRRGDEGQQVRVSYAFLYAQRVMCAEEGKLFVNKQATRDLFERCVPPDMLQWKMLLTLKTLR